MSMSTMAVARRRAVFDDYMRKGGFPELSRVRNERDYIDELVRNILQRDIEQRFKVKHVTSFEEMSQHLLNIAPAIVVDKKLKEAFGFGSQHTAKNYVGYLKQAYLLVGLHKYSPKSLQRLTVEKVYPIDVSLMNRRSDAFSGENLGWRLETIVYLELLRRYKSQGFDIYYFSERSGECDFVICEGRKAVVAIQVSYDISNEKTRKREISGLLLAAKKTGCKNLILLTDHSYEDIEAEDHRIAVRPVFDYLLNE